eukprot:3937242-Rhodomonas_salina.1
MFASCGLIHRRTIKWPSDTYSRLAFLPHQCDILPAPGPWCRLSNLSVEEPFGDRLEHFGVTLFPRNNGFTFQTPDLAWLRAGHPIQPRAGRGHGRGHRARRGGIARGMLLRKGGTAERREGKVRDEE